MAITYGKFFAPTLVPSAAATTIYTVPSTPTTNVLKAFRVRCTNITASAAAITLYAVPSGGTASTTNECVPAVSIAANDFQDFDVPDMSAGDFLQAQGGTNNAINIQQLDGYIKS